MFGLFRSKKEKQRELATLMKSFAKGDSIRRVNEAFATLGVEPDENSRKEVDVAVASSRLLDELKELEIASVSPEDQAFVDGIFLIVFADYFSRLKQCSFEISFALSFTETLGFETDSNLFHEVLGFYNNLGNSQVLKAIGDTCAKWTNEPSRSNLQHFSMLYEMLLQSVKSPD